MYTKVIQGAIQIIFLAETLALSLRHFFSYSANEAARINKAAATNKSDSTNESADTIVLISGIAFQHLLLSLWWVLR